jgi:predicted esterase YcpF (UPF0227 family)
VSGSDLALVYLHGFNSSPSARKAGLVGSYIGRQQIAADFFHPSIPDTPDEAVIFLENLMRRFSGRRVALIGSSLGGFYATWLGEKYGLDVVLVNPAVRPHELLCQYLGTNQNPYSGSYYQLTEDHIATLQSLFVSSLTRPEKRLVLLQTGDEVLDFQEAGRRFSASCCWIEHGGSHTFTGFERYLPAIFWWLAREHRIGRI